MSFGYEGAAPILDRVSFTIREGEVVGLVGRSGSGKTTIARLLVGDLAPTTGRILVGGVDVTDWHLVWRREIVGVLPEKPGFLLDRTLLENVRFGRGNDALGDVKRALRVSGVDAVAAEKSAAGGGGLDMVLRAPEQQLSAGQQRRVGLARLLAGMTPVWVIDEPGANLDPQSMREVAAALREACVGRTVVIITHDTDVFRTDRNVFLSGERVAGIGTHRELCAGNAEYARVLQEAREEGRDAAPAASRSVTLGPSPRSP